MSVSDPLPKVLYSCEPSRESKKKSDESLSRYSDIFRRFVEFIGFFQMDIQFLYKIEKINLTYLAAALDVVFLLVCVSYEGSF